MVDMRTAKLVSFWISVTGAMVNVSKAKGVKTKPIHNSQGAKPQRSLQQPNQGMHKFSAYWILLAGSGNFMAATAILLGPAAKASGPRVTLALRNFFTKEDDPTGQQADPQHMLGHCWVHFLHEKMLPLLSPRLKLRMLLVSKPGPGIMNKGLSNDAT